MYQCLIAAIALELEAAGIYTRLFRSVVFLSPQLWRKTNPPISLPYVGSSFTLIGNPW
ncbi:hypothetical protein [Laspinema palackyanum]|uniref:hypothetical protein n=1 Tax=Laspinema palackyanum TaxID=3231601 RepID=UPI00345CEFB9|nr:hypothetical protein [Laspinema sp. D2c]